MNRTEILTPPVEKSEQKSSAIARIKQIFEDLQQQESFEIDGLGAVSRLTFLMLIASSGLDDMAEYVMIGLCVIGFVLPAVYRQAWLWFGISATMVCGQLPYWYEIDNHKYLMMYWCIVMFCSTLLPDKLKARSISFNARWLIAFCFLFATIWKAMVPNYVDSSMFTLHLLEDPRFYPATMFVGGLTEDDLREVRKNLADLEELSGEEKSVALLESVPPRLRYLAMFMTWFTIGFEGLIAACFLPLGVKFLDRIRHAMLILFGIAVYALATVQGFGLLLMTMGTAQCPMEKQKTRIGLITVFAIIYLYGLGKMLFGI